MFDEAHKAKNFNSAKEEQSTKVSQAVIKIQVIRRWVPRSTVAGLGGACVGGVFFHAPLQLRHRASVRRPEHSSTSSDATDRRDHCCMTDHVALAIGI